MSLNNDLSIKLDNVSVRYRLNTQPIKTFKVQAIRFVNGRKASYRDFWAVKNASLEIKQGEVIGLIGRNGAGKSSLLKLVAQVIIPTEGRVWVRGRVAPLLVLGAGF